MTDFYADRGNFLGANPNAGKLWFPFSGDTPGCYRPDEDFFEVAEIAMNVCIIVLKIQNRIADQLAGAMVRHIPAAVDRNNCDPAILQILFTCKKMIFVAALAEGIDVPVLIQQ